jgi:hypothetical protein
MKCRQSPLSISWAMHTINATAGDEEDTAVAAPEIPRPSTRALYKGVA